jgi:Tfp pilus assembly protein PilF
MKIDTCFAPADAARLARRPKLLHRGLDQDGVRRRRAPLAHVLAAGVLGLLLLGAAGCNRAGSSSARRPPENSTLDDTHGLGQSPVAPFQEPMFNVQAEAQSGPRFGDVTPYEETESFGDAGASPLRAAQLVGPLGSQTVPGPLVDREMAAIPTPDSFSHFKPSPAKEMLEQGAQSLREGKFDDAISALYQAVNAEPTSAQAYEMLGQCYISKEEPAKAVANLDSAIRLNPKAANPYVLRATANIKLKFMRRAMDDLNKAIELEPKNIAALTWRSIAQINEGHSREAREDCNAVLKLHSGVLDAYVVRCLANLQLGDPNGARTDYQSALEHGLNAASLKMMQGWFELFGQSVNAPAKS